MQIDEELCIGCGHGMATVSLIEKIAKEVKAGSLSSEEGA